MNIDNVVLFPVVARHIPQNSEQRRAISPHVVRSAERSNLGTFVDRLCTLGGSREKARVAAMARQANLLIQWTSDSVEHVDIDFARAQLEAALRSLK